MIKIIMNEGDTDKDERSYTCIYILEQMIGQCRKELLLV